MNQNTIMECVATAKEYRDNEIDNLRSTVAKLA